MEIEIEIIIETGEILLNRDHEVMVNIAKELSPLCYEDFEKFFNEKPLNIDGKINYNSFCG